MNSPQTRPLVALISATPAAIGPATAAFAEHFPDAELWNVLDDRLQQDADAQGGVTASLTERMRRLVDHAVTEGAQGVLLTCSLYGPLAPALDEGVPVPVLAPDAAAFEAALGSGYRSVLVVGSNEPSLLDAVQRFGAAATDAGVELSVDGVVASAAAPAALAGDGDALFDALLDAVRSRPLPEAVLLAQYSLAPAAARLTEALGVPVHSGPAGAAARLASELSGGAR